jgi:lipopolysaccharide/colanic/teichoic acid biosynthesis glycosyltransferase
MRRAFDFTCALIGLVVISPLLAFVGIAIKLEGGGPVFYAHPRMGRNFKQFHLYKFRSMVPHADRVGGPVTRAGDPRVTRLGRFLRTYKLDELPQLVNVLKGDLSLVGARPEAERYVNMFRRQYEEILRDRPGITDPATFAFRNEEELLVGSDIEKMYIEEIMPRKLKLSVAYARNRTFLSDLVMLFRTLFHIPQAPPNAAKVQVSTGYETDA